MGLADSGEPLPAEYDFSVSHDELSHSDEEDDARDEDEEAQLLDGEEFEQFELDDVSRPVSLNPRVGAEVRGVRSGAPGFVSFLRGPSQSKAHVIRPLLPFVQEFPVMLLDGWLPHLWQRRLLLVVFLTAWLGALAVPLVKSKGTLKDNSGHVVRHLDCVDTLWRRNNECGLDGIDCQPFSNESFAFRCPADCAGVRVLNPRHVGPEDVNYRPLVIGGPVYRGDSFLCGSAIHAGVIDDASGGCGVVSVIGNYYSYFATSQNGIESIGFDSYFPLSFTVTNDASHVQCDSGQKDPRQLLLSVSLFFTTVLSLFTMSPAILYFVTFVGIFGHVALVSDPPNVSGPSDIILPSLVSQFVGRLLPAIFCAAIMYFACARRTIQTLVATAQVEKTVLWLGGFWMGALANHTFGWIPLQRLTAHDIEQEPGAKVFLAGIIVAIGLIVIVQAYHFWLEGRLYPYLSLYGLFIGGILVCLALPGLKLRIHHYIIALLLLPGTSMQTRPSLLYQGLLLGLFCNGVARWGFDSVLQTADALRGDGLLDSLIPEVVVPNINLNISPGTISFKWLQPKNVSMDGIEGISVMVNDVERFRRFFADEPLADQVFTWTRDQHVVQTPEYFRFAYMLGGQRSGDYSVAGTWFVNGSYASAPGFYR
ncbi:hypothetical protein B0H63DRAFT_472307 [Podospora didyma]|uniref:LCCL domain-containing protein n=1 Tax=Podospora didyma TaxID=330526 RepID=A0AAE0TZD9_9PEZI|nr:hypothetical protein B0H63DRAFT_472307 [Podospora didyma]